MVKKTLIILVLGSLLACIGPKKPQSSFNYITELILHCQFSSDSASIGDSIFVKLCYTNTTEMEINFPPNSTIFLSHSDVLAYYDYGMVSSIHLNREDETTIISVPAQSVYCNEYFIEINESLFNIGDNTMYVHYIYRQSNAFKSGAIVKGSLFSNEISLNVK